VQMVLRDRHDINTQSKSLAHNINCKVSEIYNLKNNDININNNSVITVFNGPLQTRRKIIILATCNNGETEISDEKKCVSL
jgi:hypothetical protein